MVSNEREERLSWDAYFLQMAFTSSLRSPDIETKCGCVIANEERKIVGVGYNGFPKGLPDNALPNKRPSKYPWMVHAERNAVLNLTQPGNNCTAYVSMKPCWDCTVSLYQAGIRKIKYGREKEWRGGSPEEEGMIKYMVDNTDLTIEFADPEVELVEKLRGEFINVS